MLYREAKDNEPFVQILIANLSIRIPNDLEIPKGEWLSEEFETNVEHFMEKKGFKRQNKAKWTWVFSRKSEDSLIEKITLKPFIIYGDVKSEIGIELFTEIFDSFYILARQGMHCQSNIKQGIYKTYFSREAYRSYLSKRLYLIQERLEQFIVAKKQDVRTILDEQLKVDVLLPYNVELENIYWDAVNDCKKQFLK